MLARQFQGRSHVSCSQACSTGVFRVQPVTQTSSKRRNRHHNRPLVRQASDKSDAATVSQSSQPPGSSQHRSTVASVETGSSEEWPGSSGSNCAFWQQDPSLIRRILDSKSAAEAYELILQHQQQQHAPMSEGDADALLRCCLEAGNVTLALSVYQQLQSAKRAPSSSQTALAWPAATLQHTDTLIIGLCTRLRVGDALAALDSIRSHGVPGSDEVSFGHVVNSPLPPRQPLAVVQPQEGAKIVSDSNSRYEFELFSGSVTSCTSEALQPASNPLLAAARAVGLLRAPPVAAVHELVVQPPQGNSRTFRVGTASSEVPAQPGQRITVVCSPASGLNKLKRLVLSTSPPGTQPGQPLLVSNHSTCTELLLVRPPAPGTQTGIPGWVLPAAVLLAGGDAASGLVDPALPLLIAGSVAATMGSVVASNTVLVPSLKKLPVSAVKLESIRQQLLGQHSKLDGKVKVTMQEAADDVRTLARLRQLQAKMQTVDGGQGSAYEARIERVAAVAAGIEQRLSKRLELLDGYARVMNMIEIEVEMDMQVPVAELEGLGVELEKLEELETIKEEWQFQAEAQDEVEKLLRNSPSLPMP